MPPPRSSLLLGGPHLRPRGSLVVTHSLPARAWSRPASTSSGSTTTPPRPPPPRKSITLTTDTGRIPWASLSTREKAVRGTQQSANLVIVLVGLGLTVGVSYVLYLEVFSPSSKTAIFNRAVERVRRDARCVDVLVGSPLDRTTTEGARNKTTWGQGWSLNPFGGGGSGGKEISAYGEGSWSRWARNRVISSRTETDKRGVEHMHMHFYVSGPKTEGTVWVHMTRTRGGSWEEYYLALEPEGTGERIVLEDRRGGKENGLKGGKIFGVRWW